MPNSPIQSAAALVRAWIERTSLAGCERLNTDPTTSREVVVNSALAEPDASATVFALLDIVVAQREAMAELRSCFEDGAVASGWLADTIRWDAARAAFDAALALTDPGREEGCGG